MRKFWDKSDRYIPPIKEGHLWWPFPTSLVLALKTFVVGPIVAVLIMILHSMILRTIENTVGTSGNHARGQSITTRASDAMRTVWVEEEAPPKRAG